MGETMQFPDSWNQFLHDYEFRDSLGEYTNNAMLIPSFRVKQMVEHYFQKAVPVVRCRDCIHYNESIHFCCVTGWGHDEDGFCSLGERMGGHA